jgi:hypothetical protein
MMMETTIPIPEAIGPLKLGPTDVMEHDHIVAYIAFRTAQDVTYVDQSREMGMSDGWVSDIANAVIKRALYPTRKKVTAKLREKYGDAGIPQADPTPVIVRAVGSREAVDRGFGPRSGDPNRPLAPLHEAPLFADPEEGESREDFECSAVQDTGLDCECETVEELEKNHTPSELAGFFLHLNRDREVVVEAHNTMTRNFHNASARLGQMGQQITEMASTAERMRGEVAERDRTIEGQAEDLAELEKAMDVQTQAIEDLQGFKDGTMTMLRQFATLLYQVAPPEYVPTYSKVGVETGRSSSAERVTITLGDKEVELTGVTDEDVTNLREALKDQWTIKAEARREWPRDALDMG